MGTENDAEASSGNSPGSLPEEKTLTLTEPNDRSEFSGEGDDDDTTCGNTRKRAGGSVVGDHKNVTSDKLTAWALDKISAFDPLNTLSSGGRSQCSYVSDDDDDVLSHGTDGSTRSLASFSSEKGLETVSITSDVVVSLRYTVSNTSDTPHYPRKEGMISGQSIGASPPPEKNGLMDVTSATSSSSTSSTSSASFAVNRDLDPVECMASSGSVCSLDEEDDDVDSNMTLGPDEQEEAIQLVEDMETDDGNESKASSSQFTPDEFWDWLDNVTVAFIEVNEDHMSGSHSARLHSADPEQQAVSPNLPSMNVTEPDTSNDSIEPEIDLISFEANDRAVGSTETFDRAAMLQHWGIMPGASSLELSKGPRDVSHDEIFRWNEERHQPHEPRPVPLLKHSLSAPDFRSVRGQELNGVLYGNIHRTVSFAEMVLDQDQRVVETLDDGVAQMRRIASNEDLLTTLRNLKKPSRLRNRPPISDITFQTSTDVKGMHSGDIKSYDHWYGTMVCYEPKWGRRLRLVLVLLVTVFVIAFGLSSLVSPHSSEESESPYTCKPRTVTTAFDTMSIPTTEKVRHVFEKSKEATVNAFHFAKDRLPDSLEELNAFLKESKMTAMEFYHFLKEKLPDFPVAIKPRIVQVDFQAYTTIAYQEMGELMRISKTAVTDTYDSMSERMDDPRLKESIDRLKATLTDARTLLARRLSELCVSKSLDGPKAALMTACDALYNTLTDLRVPYEPPSEVGPPQVTIDRRYMQETFDSMANETLEYVASFASVIHHLCDGFRGHCMSRASAFPSKDHEEPPYASVTISNFTPIVPPSFDMLAVFQEPKESPRSAGASESYIRTSVLQQDSSKVETSASTPLLKLVEGPSHSPHNRSEASPGPTGSETTEAERAAWEHVQEILSRLDAKGRLIELESLLVEKFGAEAVESPKLLPDGESLGFMPTPLLGKYREQHLRELWFDNLEREIVQSTLLGTKRSSSSEVWWTSSIKDSLESILDNVSRRRVLRELRAAPLSLLRFNVSLMDLWFLDKAR